jgi:hypothetical protein
MRRRLLLSLLLSSAAPLCAAAADAPDLKTRLQVMPDDVRSWAWRQASCNRWREELPDDAERAWRIKQAMNDLRCYELSRDNEILRRRYVNRSNILDLLADANELKAD